MTSLKKQLIDALTEIQNNIPGMKEALQPTIKYLKKPKVVVPNDDYAKISALSELIYRVHKNTIKTPENIKSLTDLANTPTKPDLANTSTKPAKK